MQETLDSLTRRDEPLILRLERQPGQKEARFAHLLSGPIVAETASISRPAPTAQKDERIEKLEQEVENLRAEVTELKQMFEEF